MPGLHCTLCIGVLAWLEGLYVTCIELALPPLLSGVTLISFLTGAF